MAERDSYKAKYEQITVEHKSCRIIAGCSFHIENQGGKKEEAKYRCSNCRKTFISKRGAQLHSSLHDTTSNFRCSNCSKSFFYLGSLQKHTKKKHSTPVEKK